MYISVSLYISNGFKWEHRWQSQDLRWHIQQVADHFNFRTILTSKVKTPALRDTIGLDFKKRYNISDLSHHGSQRDATTCPEAAWCLGMCWTMGRDQCPGRSMGSLPNHSLTLNLAPLGVRKRKGFYRVITSSQTPKTGRFPHKASKS